MSVDPEPRQRTVAELLAENGGAQSGRRRRRRASEDDDAPFEAGPPRDDAGPGPQAAAPPPAAAPRRPAAEPPNRRFAGGFPPEPQGPPRNGYEPNGYPPNGYPPNGYDRNGYDGNGQGRNGHTPNGYAPAPTFPDEFPDRGRPVPNGAAPPSPPQGRPVVPPLPPVPPPGRRGPEPSPPAGMPQAPGPHGPAGAPEAESPTGAFGARPPAAYGGPPPDGDGGPPTQLGAPPLDDDELDDVDQRAWTGEMAEEQRPIDATAPRRPAAPADGGPPTQAGHAPLHDDYDDEDHGVEDDPDEYRRSPRRRTAVAGLEDGDLAEDHGKAAGTGQAWAMVIAQWVGGAVVGAGVWVGFRYLWYSLPVVALALAVVLTVGLVLGVRALLRNDDLRTTMFAVLVGLLLTVSPALLVLLDR